jgi:signal transduction histidine kinase
MRISAQHGILQGKAVPWAAAVACLGLLEIVTLGRLAVIQSVRRKARERAPSRAVDDATIRFAAHELRTPISVARGYVDILRGGTLGSVPAAAQEALGLVDDKLGEIAEVAAELADMAWLHTVGREAKTEPLDMRDLIDEAVKRMKPVVGSAHQLVVDLPDRAATVVVDRVRVQAIITNLISNGIKYSPDGGEVHVKLQGDNRTVRLSVSDSGVGIKPQDLPDLFQPFSRLHEGDLSGVPGMGLGLYVARETARAHRGELSALANKGAPGTTFELILPATKRVTEVRDDNRISPAQTPAEPIFS